jgi:hypothetical protein
MRGFLAFLLGIGRNAPAYPAFHDDSLRANQGDRDPSFSFWRALVS